MDRIRTRLKLLGLVVFSLFVQQAVSTDDQAVTTQQPQRDEDALPIIQIKKASPTVKPITIDPRKKKQYISQKRPRIFTSDPSKSFNLAPCDREQKLAQRLAFITHQYWHIKKESVNGRKPVVNVPAIIDRVKRNLGRLHIVQYNKRNGLKSVLRCKNQGIINTFTNGGEKVLIDYKKNFNLKEF